MAKKEEPCQSNICSLDIKNPQAAKKLKELKPYLVAGLIAWPAYWLYRGVMWATKKDKKHLCGFLRQTHNQSKSIQYALIAFGMLATTLGPKLQSEAEKQDLKIVPAKKQEKKK